MIANTHHLESGIARRDFLRVSGIAGLAVSSNRLANPTAIPPGGDLIVGLEIGTSKVCAVVAERHPKGTIKILGIGQAPSSGVRRGVIVDFETAGPCVRAALADAERKSDVMIHSVRLSVTGEQHICSIRCVKEVGIEVEDVVLPPSRVRKQCSILMKNNSADS